MSADIIAWLRSDEGWEWSRSRLRYDFFNGPPVSMARERGPVDESEDPCGRPPLNIAATGDVA